MLKARSRQFHDDDVDLKSLRRDVEIVFQGYNPFSHVTVAQNIMLAPRMVKGITQWEAREIADTVIAKVGLREKMDCYPEQLSGGQQRVALCPRPCHGAQADAVR